MNGIDSIKRHAAEASVNDMTSDMPNKDTHNKPAQSQAQAPKPSAHKPAKPKQPAGMSGTSGTSGMNH